jgi:hypothetical protein
MNDGDDGHSDDAGFSEERGGGGAVRWTEAAALCVEMSDDAAAAWEVSERVALEDRRRGKTSERGAGRRACEEFSLFF